MSTQRWMLTGLLILALLAPGASASLAQPAASQTAAAPSASSGSMLIVENAGQWPAAARFQVWNSPLAAGRTWLAEDAIWLVVESGKSQVAGGRRQVAGGEGSADPLADLQPANLQPATLPPANLQPATLHALKLTFPGSNPDVRIEPVEALTTTISYFTGNDPDQWRPAVPVYGGVRYVDLYPGVDLVLGGRDRDWQLEVAPGAAIRQVLMQVEGADVIGIDGATLRLAVGEELLSVRLPAASFSYRVVGFSRQGLPVLTAHPALLAPQLAQPDDNPSDLLYSTFLGGRNLDIGTAIAVDEGGNAYVTGYLYLSDDFPVTPGAFDPGYNGYYDAFVAKLNPTASSLVYATFLGGTDWDFGADIAVDAGGNAYVAGRTRSSDFPTTPGAFDPSYGGGICGTAPNTYPCEDAFVVKLNSAGSALAFSTYLGGGDDEGAYGIAVDAAGSVYVAGSTSSADFPTTPGAFDTSHNGYGDAFVVKFEPVGSNLTYATFLGGGYGDAGGRIVVDAVGSAYVTGYTGSVDFPTTPSAFDTSFNGNGDAFVVKLNHAGSGLAYASFLGGGDWDVGSAIAVNGQGDAYVTGVTISNDFPTTEGAFDRTFNGGVCGMPPYTTVCRDAFVARLSANGSTLMYGTYLGGGGGGTFGDIGNGIAADSEGNAYVTGRAESADFPITPDAFDTSFNGFSDAFVSKLNPAGSTLTYSTFLGGSSSDSGHGIAVDGAGSVYVTGGGGGGTGFPTTPGVFDPVANGSDAFVAKLNTMPYAPNVLAPIEQPTAGAFVSGAVTLRGFAIDRGSATSTGIDLVHIYLDGPYGTGTIIGGATYGLDRPDVAALYGARFGPSGWELAWGTTSLTPGVHRLYLYAHRTTDNAWSLMDPHLVVVAGGHTLWLPVAIRSQ